VAQSVSVTRSTLIAVIAAPRVQKNRRGKIPRRFRAVLQTSLPHSKRFQRRLVHQARWLKISLSGLILRQRRAGLLSENSVDLAVIIALLLQRRLDVGYDLRGIVLRIRGVNWSVIIVDRVGGIAPSRIPIIGVPVVPAAVDEHDVVEMGCPPPLWLPDRMI